MTQPIGDWVGAPPPNELFTGVVLAVVKNVADPDGLGRVKVAFPWLDAEGESPWARVATLMAGAGRGTLFVPDVDDEVLVAFEHGRPDRPLVIGALWNGKDKPPAKVDGENNVRSITSRSGHVIRFDDSDGAEKFEIIDAKGKSSVVIDSVDGSITIKADGPVTIKAGADISIKAAGRLDLEGEEVAVKATKKVGMESSGAFEAKASGQMTVKGATVNIN